tara:strand:- start:1002 stop:1640 length:639 start_codon:yes stop_codon:yes gene_type:complete
MLEPLADLQLFEASHLYRYKGDWLNCSVSEVVGGDLTPFARQMIQQTKDGPEGWAERGKSIHEWLRGFLTGEPVETDERWKPWTDVLAKQEIFSDNEVLACEYLICDPERSVGGQLDFLVRTIDVETGWHSVTLGDLKTVKTTSALSGRKPATAQLGAYLRMLNEHHRLYINKCVTVISAPGRCKIIEKDPDECYLAWDEAWARYSAGQPDF